MGYAAEKEKQEKIVKKWKRIVAAAALLLVLAFCVVACIIPPDTWKYRVGLPKIDKRAQGEMRVHFVDVGQGDATIIQLPDGKVMLIDGGDNEDAHTTALLRYLRALKVEAIDYLVATHADADHCGGLTEVVRMFDVKRAFLPMVNVTENTAYATFYAQLMKEGCDYTYAARGVSLSTQGEYAYTLEFIYPYTLDTEKENESDDNAASAVLWLDYQGASVLFTGDAPKSVEEKLMLDDALDAIVGVELSDTELLKVSHHGSKDATSKAFLEYLGVEYAVISCGEDNMYGHPSPDVCENLTSVQAKTYRTDLQGTIMLSVVSDGTFTVSARGK